MKTRDRDARNQQLRVREAAEMLGVSPHTVRSWIASRKLGSVRMGRSVRVPLAEVERLVDGGWVPHRR